MGVVGWDGGVGGWWWWVLYHMGAVLVGSGVQQKWSCTLQLWCKSVLLLLLYSRLLVGCGGLWCWVVVGWIVYVVGVDREQTFSALLLCSRSGYLNLEKCKYI